MPVAATVVVIAFLSGVCGLAHEVLIARLLGTYLGNTFYVEGAAVATFVGGMGAGAAAARRLRSVWWCEAIVGVYALAIVVALALLSRIAPHAAIAALSPIGESPALAVLVVVAITLVPAILVGATVPWLAMRAAVRAGDGADADADADADGPAHRSTFATLYGLANIGAAMCVVVIAAWLVPATGVRGALAIVAAVNLVDAALLFLFVRTLSRAPARERAGDSARESAHAAARAPSDARPLVVLFALSFASGVSQLLVLKTAQALVGPYNTTFALLIAGALFGIAAGAGAVRLLRTRLVRAGPATTLAWVSLAAALACTAAFSAVTPLAELTAWLTDAGVAPVALAALVVLPLSFVPAAAFGASVPALSLSQPAESGWSGRLLLVSSAGNVAGSIAAMVVVWVAVPDAALATLLPLACAALAWLLSGRDRVMKTVVLAAAALALLPSALWPSLVVRVGNLAVSSRASLDTVQAGRGIAVRGERALGSEAVLVRDMSGDDTLILDGHVSMRVSKAGRTNRAELLVGTAPAALAAARHKGLVIGLGTGISAGALASVMDETRVVELSPAMLALMPALAPHNLGLLQRPGLEVVEGDGIAVLAADDARYDVILNTVNTPRFFASSKLYSAEFLALVRQRLAPGGVYATWIDATVGRDGVEAMVRTLAAAFPACAYVSLKGAYAELVCGEGPLALPHGEGRAAIAWPQELRLALGARADGGLDDIDALLRAAVFVELSPDVPQGPLHTLDRPVLERAAAAAEVYTPWDALRPALAKDGAGTPLDDDGVRARCEILRALSDPPPAGCR